VSVSCEGCGSTLGIAPLAATWRCEQCGRNNVNKDVVAAALRPRVERDRAPTLVDLGRMDFEAGDYARALDRFELALVEAPHDGEVWGLAAITVLRAAYFASGPEFDRARDKSRGLVERAKEAGASADFLASVQDQIEAYLLRRSIEMVGRAAMTPIRERSIEDLGRRRRAIRASLRTALDTLRESKASDDDRFAAGVELRELSQVHRFQMSARREFEVELWWLLTQLAAGDERRTRKLRSLQEADHSFRTLVFVFGTFAAIIVLGIVFALASSR
jgi:hypothetical protein